MFVANINQLLPNHQNLATCASMDCMAPHMACHVGHNAVILAQAHTGTCPMLAGSQLQHGVWPPSQAEISGTSASPTYQIESHLANILNANGQANNRRSEACWIQSAFSVSTIWKPQVWHSSRRVVTIASNCSSLP